MGSHISLWRRVYRETDVTHIECCHVLPLWQTTNGSVPTCHDRQDLTGIHVGKVTISCIMPLPHDLSRRQKSDLLGKQENPRKRWTTSGQNFWCDISQIVENGSDQIGGGLKWRRRRNGSCDNIYREFTSEIQVPNSRRCPGLLEQKIWRGKKNFGWILLTLI